MLRRRSRGLSQAPPKLRVPRSLRLVATQGGGSGSHEGTAGPQVTRCRGGFFPGAPWLMRGVLPVARTLARIRPPPERCLRAGSFAATLLARRVGGKDSARGEKKRTGSEGCPGGGIGRRTRFRVWRSQGRAGSSPVPGTTFPLHFQLVVRCHQGLDPNWTRNRGSPAAGR